jgi:hypothetical protein
MKAQINELKRMQQLAGLITESGYHKSLLPIDGKLVGNRFHIDFDDIGNLWDKKFEEKYGHEPNDLNDDDNYNYAIIKDETTEDLESKLFQIYNKFITLKYIY